MHVSEGEIRAYHDQELSPQALRRIRSHLENCPRCQRIAAMLEIRTGEVSAYLAHLDSGSEQLYTSPKTARANLSARLSRLEKENENMWNKLTSQVPRPVWAALAIVIVLVVALAFEPVRAVANDFLGLFRVEQVRVVQVDRETLPGELESSSQLEQMFTEYVQVESEGEPQEVASAEEATELTGIPVRLPGQIEGEPKLVVQPGGHLEFVVDLDLVQAVLNDIDRSDIVLPQELDGATVELDIPPSVTAGFGECDESAMEDFDPDEGPRGLPEFNCTLLLQMPSPSFSAPPGLDVTQIGEAYLQILGMTKEEAASFARNVDWATTFVIPIPRYSAEHQDVTVDGVNGTLVQTRYGNQYVLIWVKDGMLYALSGAGDGASALEIAESLQ